jgi:hypothetical protein
LAAVLAIIVASPVHSQPSEADALQRFQSLTAQSEEAYQSGKYAKGTELAEGALRLAVETFGDRDPQTVNRRPTLTPPDLGPKWLYQRRNCRFLEDLIGAQS